MTGQPRSELRLDECWLMDARGQEWVSDNEAVKAYLGEWGRFGGRHSVAAGHGVLIQVS